MAQRLQVIRHHGPLRDPCEFKHLIDPHDDLAPEVEPRAACRHHAHLRLMPSHELPHFVGQHRIA
jgi:hypothetical protein